MTTISATTAAASRPAKLPPSASCPGLRGTKSSSEPQDGLQQVFTKFVGQTFFGHMIKAMRSTVGKPAYFHGGQAEEVFRSQLDQTLAEQMTKASAERFANPLFERQFPDLRAAQQESNGGAGLDELSQLLRR